jgi:HEAT repeat protein
VSRSLVLFASIALVSCSKATNHDPADASALTSATSSASAAPGPLLPRIRPFAELPETSICAPPRRYDVAAFPGLAAAIPKLGVRLDAYDPGVRAGVIRRLPLTADKEVVQLLRQMLDDPFLEVYGAAAIGLAARGVDVPANYVYPHIKLNLEGARSRKRPFEPLPAPEDLDRARAALDACRDIDNPRCSDQAEALRGGSKEDAPRLRALLKSKSPYAVQRAAAALIDIGEVDDALEGLRALCDRVAVGGSTSDQGAYTREMLRLLVAFGDRRAPFKLADVLRWVDATAAMNAKELSQHGVYPAKILFEHCGNTASGGATADDWEAHLRTGPPPPWTAARSWVWPAPKGLSERDCRQRGGGWGLDDQGQCVIRTFVVR